MLVVQGLWLPTLIRRLGIDGGGGGDEEIPARLIAASTVAFMQTAEFEDVCYEVDGSTEGGVIAFTKSLAREMAQHQINVNCVCHGPTDTPLLDSVTDKLRESLAKAIPFRRLAQPQEIADAALFFASDRARYITGQVLRVSGGLTIAG